MARAEFAVHLLNDLGKDHAGLIAEAFTTLLNEVEYLVYPATMGREMSIVRTKLEEASFFAKKALAVQPEYQQ